MLCWAKRGQFSEAAITVRHRLLLLLLLLLLLPEPVSSSDVTTPVYKKGKVRFSLHRLASRRNHDTWLFSNIGEPGLQH